MSEPRPESRSGPSPPYCPDPKISVSFWPSCCVPLGILPLGVVVALPTTLDPFPFPLLPWETWGEVSQGCSVPRCSPQIHLPWGGSQSSSHGCKLPSVFHQNTGRDPPWGHQDRLPGGGQGSRWRLHPESLLVPAPPQKKPPCFQAAGKTL